MTIKKGRHLMRDGTTAVIITTEAEGDQPIVGYRVDSMGQTRAHSWGADGRYIRDREEEGPLDLVSAWQYVNFYVDAPPCSHPSAEEAESNRSVGCFLTARFAPGENPEEIWREEWD